MKSRAMAAIAIVELLVSGVDGFGAEQFQRLGGSQIRAKFVGMEMTDNVHWADVFGPNGNLKSYLMGRKKDGKWSIEKDELCVDRGTDDGGCYQAWLSGNGCPTRAIGPYTPWRLITSVGDIAACSAAVFQPSVGKDGLA